MARQWSSFVRFVAVEDELEHIGDLLDPSQDVGLAMEAGSKVQAYELTGDVFESKKTDKVFTIKKVLAPLKKTECNTIRCLGLNYRDHARETNMAIPDEPILFNKPRTALTGPGPLVISKPAQDGTADYEAELCLVLSKDAKNIKASEWQDYVLGYTCANDISARGPQFRSSQWTFSKSFDESCPIGPIIRADIGHPENLEIRAVVNGTVYQNSNTSEMIFSIPHILEFLSQDTTLEKGSIILTGTPHGIGHFFKPPVVLRPGDDVRIQIENIGTLISKIEYA